MSDEALETARVVILGLALTGAAGCHAALDAYCDVFEETPACCAHRNGHSSAPMGSGPWTWDRSSGACVRLYMAPLPPGPPS
jgi:hypothetical protein